MVAAPTNVEDISPWAPLRVPTFRAFWLASLASNFGTWIHEIGAGWLMASLDPAPEMVASVRTAMAVPIVLLAIPAGALADRVDRRRLLLATQFALFATTATLGALTFAGTITPWLLLGLTFVIGLGMVLHVPTWQASVPELVPRRQLTRAVALGSISFNLARALGPAAGGAMIALLGVWSAFSFNSLSFLFVIFVLLSWRRDRTESSRGMTFGRSLTQGLLFVFRKRIMRHVLIGVGLFVLPASAWWSLLPLIAKKQLSWDADGYGLLVGAIGVGAVAAAALLPRTQRWLTRDGIVTCAMLLFASGLAVVSQTHQPPIAMAAALAMGAGWMMTLTTLNTTAQVTLPGQLRARGMGCYLTAMASSMSVGSFLWGRVAGSLGLSNAIAIAAAILVVTAIAHLGFRIDPPSRRGRRQR